MRAWEKWHPLSEQFISPQRREEILHGCPACGCTMPLHIQIRAEKPPHAYECPCGTRWAVIDNVAQRYP